MPASEGPILDAGQLELPTDKVSLGAIRKVEPELCEGEETRIEASEVIAAIDHEVALARNAFDASLGIPHRARYWTRDHVVDVLNDVYMRYGLSSGMHETEEPARGIERQATAQAERHEGRSR